MEITQETLSLRTNPESFQSWCSLLVAVTKKKNNSSLVWDENKTPPPLPATIDYICYFNLKPISDYQNLIILYNLIGIFASFR